MKSSTHGSKKKIASLDVASGHKFVDISPHQHQSATVQNILQYVEPIPVALRCLDVLNIFIDNTSLLIAPIVDAQHKPVGLIDRGRLTEIFFKPYARDLHHKKAIGEIMTTDPVIVDINTSIDDLANITINAGMRHMAQGFIVVENTLYVGMATGHRLLEEITHRKQQELYTLAHYDQLTGVPNRLLFKDRLMQACQQAKRSKKPFALVFVDLDRFKYINDTLGHSFGDQLLINFAHRLSACVRESDTVARLGGDEFVVILQNLSEAIHAEKVAATMIDKIRQPMMILGREVNMTASLGLALYPNHDDTVDGLIRKADAAMYVVKEKGRNGFLMFNERYDQNLSERNTFVTELKKAIDRQELALFYQPQIDTTTNQVMGVEALLRWYHPTQGLLMPSKFIGVAEDVGFIVTIGEWVINEACRQQVEWLDQGLPPLRIAINVSAIQFRQQDFSSRVQQIIHDYGIDPNYIELELTETMVMANPVQTVSTMSELKAIGIKIAIDDFGIGHSSLSYLSQFPLDRIKIDQSFVRDIQNFKANNVIVKAIVAIGQSLGISLIAEGVETEAELACIKSHNCHDIQGFYFTKPLPAHKFKDWLLQHVQRSLK